MTVRLTAMLLLAALFTLFPGGAGVRAQDEPELVWEETQIVGGAVFGLATATAESEEPPPARVGQVLMAAGYGVFSSVYGDSWERDDRTGWLKSAVAAPGGKAQFVSGSDGVWRSTNSGRSWSRSRVRDEDPAKVLAMSPDWSTDGASYAITSEDGRLYKMERDRASWIEVALETGQDHWTGAVAFSPLTAVDETLFAGTDAGIFKSENNGQTWTMVSDETAPAFGPEGGAVWHQGLIVSPDYGDDPARIEDPETPTLFAFNEHGVYRSDDDGVSWTTVPLDVDMVRSLAVSPGWPRDLTLMAAVSDADGSVAAISENGGQNWRMVAGHHGLAGTSVAMAVDYAPPFRGKPRNGIFMPIVVRNAAVETGPGPRVEGSREAYLATDGDGVWRTKNAGQTWERVETTFHGVEPRSIALMPGGTSAPALLGTNMTGLYASNDAGKSWSRVEGSGLPMGEGQTINRIRLSPTYETDGTVVIAATSGIWVSRNRGESWARAQGSTASVNVALSPGFGQSGEARAPGSRSMDGGATWQPDEKTTAALSFAYHPDYPTVQTIWMGTAGGLMVSADGGGSWAAVDDSTVEETAVFDIVPVLIRASVDPMRVFAGTDGGVVQSEDAGVAWTRSSGTFGRDTYTVAAHVTSQPVGAVLLAASESGVSWSFNRGIDWARDANSPEPAVDAAMSPDGCLFLVASSSSTSRATAVVEPRCVPVPR